MNDFTKSITQQVTSALHEDIGSEDITALLIPANTQLSVHLICREHAILCGTDWFNASFSHLDSGLKIEWFVTDGDTLQPDQTVCKISGNARSILTAERTALN
ncbi:MAG: nicotinate-nucleotide diphosphorylase (carboxylating), partial [Gammaproteobacteria bacterium]|nr:nicotinate-nucleotide diphosphorylase (carboxylating) [Gammaproteobacteria bacterium]